VGWVANRDSPHVPVIEGFRSLRTNIDFSGSRQPRTLLITSGLRSEGKTVVAANLAVAFAESGRRVTLVDADLRRPALHHQFHLPNDRGLTDLLQSSDPQAVDLTLATNVKGLRVLPAGPNAVNPSELISSRKMGLVIAILRDGADLVIFDSPSVLAVSEAPMLASMVDATLIVVVAGATPAPALRDTRDALVRTTGVVVGTVLNRVPRSWTNQPSNAYSGLVRHEDTGRLQAEDRSTP
jgi:capsular exopolysaccharide synthesis family protein